MGAKDKIAAEVNAVVRGAIADRWELAQECARAEHRGEIVKALGEARSALKDAARLIERGVVI